MLDIVYAINLTKYLAFETAYLPWHTALHSFEYLNDMLESSRISSKFNQYILNLLSPIYTKLGWNEKKEETWQDK